MKQFADASKEHAQNGARPRHETHACSWDPGGAERALCAFETLLSAFDRLELPYAVGGSVASSEHGNYRFTNDVDIIVSLNEDRVDKFVAALGNAFYADADAIRQGVRLRTSASIIHMATAYKFDLFPAGDQPFAHRELERRQFRKVAFDGEQIEFAMVSAEDAILAKLDWMRQSGGLSEQQQRDILGIMAVQGDRLERAYLETSAAELGVLDDLRRLFQEASATE